MRTAGILALLTLVVPARAQFGRVGWTTTDVPIHDPSIIRQGSRYYVFATGPGIVVWSSPDRVHWTREPPVFATPPAWTVRAVPTFRGLFWAPDITCRDGRYTLYYAVSAFGRNTSAIGVATNATLDRHSPQFRWKDRGKVIESVPGLSNWNAIDPNLARARDGTPYLAFGSFWSGIKLIRLRPDLLRPADPIGPASVLPTLASRMKDPDRPNPPAPPGNPPDAGGNAIEAPFIYRHGKYDYLFASIDYCCRGARSTYKMIVGRAPHLAGPYVDRDGVPLARGGGTLLLAGDAHWYGVGHNSVARFGGVDYIVFHGYDATDPHARSKLRIEPLRWTADGWPEVAGGS
jgi:arabinan endo-1,5-alpha-L-arabinosidase